MKSNIDMLPKIKKTSSIISIEDIKGMKYTVSINTKKDQIGLTYYDRKKNSKYKSFVYISALIKSIHEQIENDKRS